MTTLLKHLLDAGDARAAADSLVGLKSGKVQIICQGWAHETAPPAAIEVITVAPATPRAPLLLHPYPYTIRRRTTACWLRIPCLSPPVSRLQVRGWKLLANDLILAPPPAPAPPMYGGGGGGQWGGGGGHMGMGGMGGGHGYGGGGGYGQRSLPATEATEKAAAAAARRRRLRRLRRRRRLRWRRNGANASAGMLPPARRALPISAPFSHHR